MAYSVRGPGTDVGGKSGMSEYCWGLNAPSRSRWCKPLNHCWDGGPPGTG